MEFWFCVVLTLSLSTNVLGLPEGAPPAACENFTPNHTINTPSDDPVPYTVNISSIGDSYMPGETYTIILSGDDMDSNFRGFLVQARKVADDGPVGAFVIGPNSTDQQNRCMDDTGVTHTNNTEKTTVELTWTAPPAGTGEIVFRFAFVDMFSTFWANQTTAMIREATNETTMTPTMENMTASTESTQGDIPTPSVTVTSTDSASDVMTPTVTSTSQGTPTSTPGDTGGTTGVAASSMMILLLISIITVAIYM